MHSKQKKSSFIFKLFSMRRLKKIFQKKNIEYIFKEEVMTKFKFKINNVEHTRKKERICRHENEDEMRKE